MRGNSAREDATMFELRRLLAATPAAMWSERTSASTPDDRHGLAEDSTRSRAGNGSDRSFERGAFAVGDATRLAILAQCVP